jgi:hypothetical protein
MGFIGYCSSCKERVKVRGNSSPSSPSSTALYYEGACPQCQGAVKEIKQVPKFGGKWRA